MARWTLALDAVFAPLVGMCGVPGLFLLLRLL